MDVTLNVPVPRYVAKYIAEKHNLKPGQAWRIHTRGIEDTLVASLLERHVDRYEEYHKNETVLHILLPQNIYLRRGMFLSQGAIDEFITFIRDRIYEECTLYCKGVRQGVGVKKVDKVVTNVATVKKMQPARIRRVPAIEGPKFFSQKDSITDILNKYQITDHDLRFDSVLKHVQRRIPA